MRRIIEFDRFFCFRNQPQLQLGKHVFIGKPQKRAATPQSWAAPASLRAFTSFHHGTGTIPAINARIIPSRSAIRASKNPVTAVEAVAARQNKSDAPAAPVRDPRRRNPCQRFPTCATREGSRHRSRPSIRPRNPRTLGCKHDDAVQRFVRRDGNGAAIPSEGSAQAASVCEPRTEYAASAYPRAPAGTPARASPRQLSQSGCNEDQSPNHGPTTCRFSGPIVISTTMLRPQKPTLGSGIDFAPTEGHSADPGSRSAPDCAWSCPLNRPIDCTGSTWRS